MSTRLIFLGSKSIGSRCFSHLLDRQEELDFSVLAVGTNSRGEKVRELARREKIPVIEEVSELHEFDYELLLSVQYHKVLNCSEISTAKRLAVNLHMAPLPEYRGCNQFSFAIVNGEREFGTTLHIMDRGVDTGDILAERRFPISENIFVSDLLQKTEEHSFQMFCQELEGLVHGKLRARPQDRYKSRKRSEFHYRKEIESLKCIDPRWPREKIDRHIRATLLDGFPPPFMDFGSYRVNLSLKD